MNDPTTPFEKFSAAMAGFGFACLAFLFSAVVLVPFTGNLGEAVGLPNGITAGLIFFELFGLTTLAGIAGVAVISRSIAQTRETL